MARYSTSTAKTLRPRADDWWDNDPPMLPECTVDDHVATNTGLVDLNGDAIMREPNPMGFGKEGEW